MSARGAGTGFDQENLLRYLEELAVLHNCDVYSARERVQEEAESNGISPLEAAHQCLRAARQKASTGEVDPW